MGKLLPSKFGIKIRKESRVKKVKKGVLKSAPILRLFPNLISQKTPFFVTFSRKIRLFSNLENAKKRKNDTFLTKLKICSSVNEEPLYNK